MARPREFDEQEVLDKARDAFWSRGYCATSLADLTAAMGLTKGSVYKAFGDKHALFLRTLDNYLSDGYEYLRETLTANPSPSQGLRAWMDSIVDMATTNKAPCGCYAVNSIIELAPHDAVVKQRLLTHIKRVEKVYADIVSRGIQAGEMRASLDPAMAAGFISNAIYGLQVRGRSKLTRSEAEATVAMLMASLG